MPRQPSRKSALDPDQFPALREFLRGYFHQDLEDEYGSPAAAARQFWQDADEAQRKAVASEWARLLEWSKTLPLNEINQSLQKLGSAWGFDSLADLQFLAEIFRKGRTAR